MALAILALLVLPFLSSTAIRVSSFKPLFEIFFGIFVVIVLTLGWVGGKPIEPTYYFIGQISTFGYFFYFLVLVIFSSRVDFFFLEHSMFSNTASIYRLRGGNSYNHSFF